EEIRKLSTAVEQSPSVIAITDLNGNLEYVNPKFTELTGYTNEEVIGQNPRTLKSRDQPDEMYEELWATISSGNTWRGEFHNRKKNGDLFWEAASVSPIFDKQGEITNYIKVAENITERKLTEEALRESEEKFRLISEQSLLAIGIIQDGHIIYANEMYSKLTGYSLEEIYGWEPYGYARTVYKDDLPLVMKQSRKKQAGDEDVITNYQFRGFTKSKEIVWWDLHSSTITYHGRPADLFTLIDITERVTSEKDREALQAKLQHAQKMEAIGTLAGGVAHDLNNILGGLVSYPELLLLQLPDDSPLRKSILTIQKSGEKAAAVVQDLLTLARRGVVVTDVVSLNDVISEYLKSPEHENLQSFHPTVHI
ncbi:MAG: PAS domain S-box protein, partial [Deltaproteobacteria bacterium]|nr:PAS domain S-box protein [Deltaproteobacteria bacterium]